VHEIGEEIKAAGRLAVRVCGTPRSGGATRLAARVVVDVRRVLFAILSCSALAVACTSDDAADEPAATSSSSSDPTGSSDATSSTTMSAETGIDASTSTTANDDSSSNVDASSGETSSTTTGPTSGPGVLPGETGLEAFCRRYVECRGSYYADQQECLDESYGYWGDCPSRTAALDVFGACMSVIECTDWTPDAYNPANTPCASEWEALGASDPCG
jgi:hypothetical protein